MRVSHLAAQAGVVETRTGSMFTGVIWGEVLMPHADGAGLNRVTFSPGARTFWHRHAGGQMLICESGSGLVVTRSGEITPIHDGVVVHACPQEDHWHGAMPDAFMSHLSCVLQGETMWLEEVPEEDYQRAVAEARAMRAAS